jgi:hypothetical protein
MNKVKDSSLIIFSENPLEFFEYEDSIDFSRFSSTDNHISAILGNPIVGLSEYQKFSLRKFLYIPNKKPIELYIPLMFWHSRDYGLAIPTAALSYSHRSISISL